MNKKKTNLGQHIHVYSSMAEMEQQFVKDVKTVGDEFMKVIDEYFDIGIPYDQAVLCTILADLFATLNSIAEDDGVNLEDAFKGIYHEARNMIVDAEIDKNNH